MFSNKFYFLKITIALSTVVWLSYISEEHFSEKYPRFYNYLALPEKNHNQYVGTEIDKVIENNPAERSFTIEENGFTIKVQNAPQIPENGDYVNLWARFDKSGFLQPLPGKMVIHKNYKIKRGLMYAISLVAIGVWFFYFVKVFRPNLHTGLFTSKGG